MKIIKPYHEIMNMPEPGEILKHIERAARLCYKSEDKIKEGSAEELIKRLSMLGHHSVLEHISVSVRIVCDRGVSHEIVRHRLCSFCLSGDTEVSEILLFKWSLKKLWDLQNDKTENGILKLIKLRSVNVRTAKIVPGNIKKIIDSGMKEMYKVTTETGKTIKSSMKHLFLSEFGNWQRLEELGIGKKVVIEDIEQKHRPVRVDKIVDIEHIGLEQAYDIEMDTTDPNLMNFVADGFVVHNSQESTRYANYAKDKFGNEITVIKPFFWKEDTLQYARWKKAMEFTEDTYLNMVFSGATAQEARSVLPNSLKTEIVVTANLREWHHIFKLRCSKAAHPQIREVMLPILSDFHEQIPVIYGDIYDKYSYEIQKNFKSEK